MVKFVIWGAGTNGMNVLTSLRRGSVVGCIDSSEEKIGMKLIDDVPIISYDEYKSLYRQYWIIVSIMLFDDVVRNLQENGIYNYLIFLNEDICLSACRRIEKNKNVSFKFSNSGMNYIYGFSLYSVLLYEYLVENGYLACIVPHHNIGTDVLEAARIQQYWLINDFPEKISSSDCVIETIRMSAGIHPLGCPLIDCDVINNNENQTFAGRLQLFRNIHAKKRCFIVATGPSLCVNDLNVLHQNNEICISMNGILNVFNDTLWRPNYYVVSDGIGIDLWGDTLCNVYQGGLFISDNSLAFWDSKRGRNCYRFHQVQETLSAKSLPSFSEDFSVRVYSGLTVTYACLQLAVYMGFSEIYLLGTDYYYTPDSNAENDHFCKNYSSKANFHYDEVGRAYLSAKKYCELHNVKVYNATRGGKLEVFERASFESLFNGG